MSTKPPPSLLEPYLQLPPETSLITLTSTLGCSINWLTARFIASTLDPSQNTAILLVSWMRDLPFWKSEIRRTTGLDVSKSPGTFTYMDQFSHPSSLQETQSRIVSALRRPDTPTTVLALDSPDVLLATASTTAHELNQFLLQLRSQVHCTLLGCSADLPLISAATPENNPNNPMETATAAFVTAQAHSSRLVMSVRELDTGAARDVSGVLRITRGGDIEAGDEVKEAELLYLIQRDGVAKVFSRGSGDVS